jgi:hypothetical protein
MQRTKTQPNRPLDFAISALLEPAPPANYPVPPARRQTPADKNAADTARGVDRWADEELFEEDLRAALHMMRPHRRERLLGWTEYRTGGRHFRATISWDDDFTADDAANPDPQPADDLFKVPNFADVLESLVVGSIRADTDLTPEERTAAYQALVRDLAHRLNPDRLM